MDVDTATASAGGTDAPPEDDEYEFEVVEELVLLRASETALSIEPDDMLRIEGLGTDTPELIVNGGARGEQKLRGQYEHVVGTSVLVGGDGPSGPEGLQRELLRRKDAGESLADATTVLRAQEGAQPIVLGVADSRVTLTGYGPGRASGTAPPKKPAKKKKK